MVAGTLSKNEGVKMIDFFESWAEFFFFVLLVIGFIFSVFAPSAFVPTAVVIIHRIEGTVVVAST